jgi:hypothetical protein
MNLMPQLPLATTEAAPQQSSVREPTGVLTRLEHLLRVGQISEAASVAIGTYRECPSKLFGNTGNALQNAHQWLSARLQRSARERFFEDADLTPAIAQLLLDPEFNILNRPFENKKLAEFMRDALAGAWQRNGETIIIANPPALNDGQHRAMVALITGQRLPVSFAFGLKRDSRFTVDLGAKRTPGARLHMHGVASGNAKQAIIALVFPLLNGHQPTHSERDTFYFAKQASIECAHELTSSIRLGGTNKSALGAAATYILLKGGHDTFVRAFFTQLKSGDGLFAGDSILALRNGLSAQGRKMGAMQIMKSICAHYNRYRTRKRTKRFIDADQFENIEAM